MFQFFDETAFLNEWCKTRTISQLTGFERISNFEMEEEDGWGEGFNFILDNGTRSTQRDEFGRNYDHMIPKKALNKIRSVNIYYHDVYHFIFGFTFFDKDGALLWEIGNIWYSLK